MFNKIINTICLITSVILTVPTFIQAKSKPYISTFSNIKIVILDTSLLDDGKISFEMSNANINTTMSMQNSTFIFPVTQNIRNIKLPLKMGINYGRIFYFSKRGDEPFNRSNNLFIFKSGENITLYIGKKNVSFKGRGSAKYNCLREIYDQNILIPPAEEYLQWKKHDYQRVIQGRIRQVDSLYYVKNRILKQYKRKIEPNIYKYIQADCWSLHNHALINIYLSEVIVDGEKRGVYASTFEEFYPKFIKTLNKQQFTDEILAESYQYGDFLLEKLRFELRFLNYSKPDFYHKYNFEEEISYVKKNYTGNVRDKLALVLFYYESQFRPDSYLYFASTIKGMGNNYYRKGLLKLLKISTGFAFPFELPNSIGNIVQLNDFRGKIVVLDFWFTGCEACALLTEEMKPIILSYKSEPNLVFITINTDPTKATWMKSLESEKYTANNEINLWTNGLGVNHPMLKFHNIIGYPTVMIIGKRGEVISMAPPRPRKDYPNSRDEFKTFLNSHL